MAAAVLPVTSHAAGAAACVRQRRNALEAAPGRHGVGRVEAPGLRGGRAALPARVSAARLVAAAASAKPSSKGPDECLWADTVTINFEADVQAKPGQSLYITGNLPELGGWAADKAVPLSFPAGGSAWRGRLDLPPGTRADFKLVLVQPDGASAWQDGPNRKLEVPYCTLSATARCSWDSAEVSVKPGEQPRAPSGGGHAPGSAPGEAVVRTVLTIHMEEADHSASYCLVGNAPQLGAWTVGKGPACRWVRPQELGSVFELPQGQAAEFKVVKVDGAGNAQWQGGENRRIDVPLCSSDAAVFASTSWQSEPVHAELFDGELAAVKVEQIRLRARLMAVSPQAAAQNEAAARGQGQGSRGTGGVEMARAY